MRRDAMPSWLGLASQRSHISMARQPWSAGGRRGTPTSNPQSSWCIWSAIHSSISSIHRQGQAGKGMPGTVRASSSSDADDQSAIKEKLGGIHMAILCLIVGFDCMRLHPALIAMVNSTWLMQSCTFRPRTPEDSTARASSLVPLQSMCPSAQVPGSLRPVISQYCRVSS
ncbi:hypothetical protein BGZ61DRAFT_130880 [Ilyonectria robusta]|uniref:uncharacterized protein n=1 Tax=Ilyonectria robusta TaxID=1079257 RepID=UPI001E8DFE10|nr:uncharacterized protein BGZ61DRAFT_130880 [Ilyonectria robusta]KAH8734855.1 hypothetical protein BGZ61DRAFT_130880 [Ilyonectria robusta]